MTDIVENKVYFAEETEEIGNVFGGAVGILDNHIGKKNYNEIMIGSKGPTHLSKSGNFVIASCYSDSSVVQLKIDGEKPFEIKTIRHKGSSVDPRRQSCPHPHFSLFSPLNDHLIVCDLGLDKIFIYPFDKEKGIVGEGKTFDAPRGYGPRHAVFSASGKYLYVVTEMGSAVLVYEYSSSGELKLIQEISTLEENAVNQCGAIRINSLGTELFVTNRGKDNVAFYKIAENGMLSYEGFVECSSWPRDAVFSPDEKYILVAAQKADSLDVYSYSYDAMLPLKDRVKHYKTIQMPKGFNPSSIAFFK